jgi:hypothetical protein
MANEIFRGEEVQSEKARAAAPQPVTNSAPAAHKPYSAFQYTVSARIG